MCQISSKVGLFAMVLCSSLLGSRAAIAAQPTTVPLVNHGPTLSADIGGHKVRLMFDLGNAAALALPHATLDVLGITPTGPGRKFMGFKGDTVESRSFEVPRLSIGSAVFMNVTGIEDFHDQASYGAQGFIGPSLLVAYRVVLDYRGGKMTLIPPEARHIEQAGCLGTAVATPDGVAKAQTDFGDLVLVWDTGAGVSFIRKSRIDPKHAKVVNDAVRAQHFRLNGVDFGPLGFRLIEFSEPPGVDGFIGGNFFARHVVCLDFPGKRILIQR